MREDSSGLLIDRLAASIVDESLPLKDVEKELRGSVAEVAVKKRGLGKREVANRCGVTEKSIDNYLKEVRANPKSPEREIHRLLQDGSLSLEEIYEGVRPTLCHGRHFTLDDAKRALDKLVRTGEVEEVPGKRYKGSERPTICNPVTVEAYRDLVDEKARDLDYVILRQKEVSAHELHPKGAQKFSRVAGDTNLIRIDFTADIPEEGIPEFYEKLSAEIARLTLKYEKKKGGTRVRVIIGMRAVAFLLAGLLFLVFGSPRLDAQDAAPAGGDAGQTIEMAGRHCEETWELDSRMGGGGDQQSDPLVDQDDPVDPNDPNSAGRDRRDLPTVIVRGDANLDHMVDVSDAIMILGYLTQGKAISCSRAADVNADGRLSLVDPVRLIRFLFLNEVDEVEIGREVDAPSDDGLPCEAVEGSGG